MKGSLEYIYLRAHDEYVDVPTDLNVFAAVLCRIIILYLIFE